MNNSKQKELNRDSISWLLIGVASVTLYINPSVFDPFNTPKLILLMLIAAWLSGHVAHILKNNYKKIRAQVILPFALLLIFNISLLISSFMTDVKFVAFFGETQRRNGFIQYLSLTVLMIFAVLNIYVKNVVKVYKAGIITGLILSVYGLLQIYGYDMFKWDNPYNSMISTLGNPNFASAMLAVLLVISFTSLFLQQLPTIYKGFSVLVVITSLMAITESSSRQGLVVIAFSLMFYFTVASFIKSKKLGVAFSIGSSAVFILSILGMLQIGPMSRFLYKDSVSVRGYYWRAGIEMFQNNILTGVGVDRYESYFKQFRESGYSLKYGYEISSSNAHNTFIQFFATAGIVAGSTYLLLLLVIFVSSLKTLTKVNREEKRILLGLLSAWVGFQAQSLISIDNIGVSVWGWLLSGALLGLTLSVNLGSEKYSITQNSYKNKKSLGLFQPLISILFLTPVIISSYLLYKSETDYYKTRAEIFSVRPETKTLALNHAQQLLNNSLSDPQYKYFAALALYDLGLQSEAERELNSLLSADPRNLNYLKSLSIIESRKGNIAGQVKYLEQILIYDPWNAQIYLDLCVLYNSLGDFEKAKEFGMKVLEINPSSDYAEKVKQAIKL